MWRLRSRACWEDAAALLAPRAATEPGTALRRTAVLTERCVFTAEGWEAAEDSLRSAEALATDDEERGAAACERGHLAYASTLLGGYGTGPTRRVPRWAGRQRCWVPARRRVRCWTSGGG
ncbi:hypothetical protein GCM10020000_17230 [Streptomyces olivoverticillatus]